MKRRSFLAASAACLTAGLLRQAQGAASTVEDQLDALAASARAELRSPGLAYGVVRADGTSFGRGLGVAEHGRDRPIRINTLFHMASVTKPFVATAIAQRVEQGRLRLDQRLAEVLPELSLADPRARSITIEQVLTHSAGLPDVEDYRWEQPETDEAALQRYIASLSEHRLLFAPGTGFAYSNIGFEILARVIEVLDDAPFETAVRDTLLRPLGMRSSTLLYPEADKAQIAVPHVAEKKDGQVRASAVFPYNRRHAGSSTLLSNVDDMLRWIRANLDNGVIDGKRIMSPQTARDLRTPRPVEIKQGSTLPPGSRPALSWFVVPHAGREIVAHGGADLGFVSICALCPQDRCGIVAMANCLGEQGGAPLLRFALQVFASRLLAA